jgi:hypothetical protein
MLVLERLLHVYSSCFQTTNEGLSQPNNDEDVTFYYYHFAISQN